jgi:hypothetical protein
MPFQRLFDTPIRPVRRIRLQDFERFALNRFYKAGVQAVVGVNPGFQKGKAIALQQ